MTGKEFLQSKWVQMAQRPGAAGGIGRRLVSWMKGVRNAQLLGRARDLYNYFRSGKATPVQKTIVLAALLYLISPLDVVPDWIPVAGLLDDLGVATFVLNYIFRQLDGPAEDEDLSTSESPTPHE